MPLTEFQRTVLRLLRKQRNPNSYVAGGTAIHRSPNSKRYSNDIDFFHDTDEAVITSSQSDIEHLQNVGYSVEKLIHQPSFIRVVIAKGGDSLKLEWVRDTAFRFFPVVEDEELGYRLHDVDLAVNKCLALANRNEVRDIIDLLHLHESTIEIAPACFAACGKDPGFSPSLILDCMKRNSIIDTHKLEAEAVIPELIPEQLKRDWLKVLAQTEEVLHSLPSGDVGALYMDKKGKVLHPFTEQKRRNAILHYGSVGGSWPRVV
jgi:predicted nucleotidyltransferase component of viral defense system